MSRGTAVVAARSRAGVPGVAARYARAGRTLAVLAVAVVIPLVNSDLYFLRVADTALIVAILALSEQLVFGFAGQISVGQAVFAAAGAYTTALLTTKSGMPFLVGLVAGVGAATALGALIAPITRIRGERLAFATLALNALVIVVISNVDALGGPNGLPGIPPPSIAGFTFDTQFRLYFLALAFLTLTYLLVARLVRFRFGRALRALQRNEVAAAAMGIDPAPYKMKVFALGGAIAGVSGVLLAHSTSFIGPDTFSTNLSILVIAMVVVGGLGSWPGAIVGAVALTFLPEYLRGFGDYQLIIYGLLITVVMIAAPGGLVGSLKRLVRHVRARARPAPEPTP